VRLKNRSGVGLLLPALHPFRWGIPFVLGCRPMCGTFAAGVKCHCAPPYNITAAHASPISPCRGAYSNPLRGGAPPLLKKSGGGSGVWHPGRLYNEHPKKQKSTGHSRALSATKRNLALNRSSSELLHALLHPVTASGRGTQIPFARCRTAHTVPGFRFHSRPNHQRCTESSALVERVA